ncbi:hypothetical protein A4A49_42973, partial [Nicotiana attenuata]
LDVQPVNDNVIEEQGTQVEGGNHVDIQNNGVDKTAAELSQAVVVSKIDKGPCPPSRDIPAKRALATISNVVNPIVEAYDKLASAVKIMSSNHASRNDIQDNAPEKVNRMDALSGRGSKGLVAPGKSEHIVSVTQAFDCDGKIAQLTTEGRGDRGMVNMQRSKQGVSAVEDSSSEFGQHRALTNSTAVTRSRTNEQCQSSRTEQLISATCKKNRITNVGCKDRWYKNAADKTEIEEKLQGSEITFMRCRQKRMNEGLHPQQNRTTEMIGGVTLQGLSRRINKQMILASESLSIQLRDGRFRDFGSRNEEEDRDSMSSRFDRERSGWIESEGAECR